MPFIGVIKVRLIKDKRHAQQPFPKINRRLAICTCQRNVMDAQHLNFAHSILLTRLELAYRTTPPDGMRQIRSKMRGLPPQLTSIPSFTQSAIAL